MMTQEVILSKRLTLKGHDSQVPLFADGTLPLAFRVGACHCGGGFVRLCRGIGS